MISHGGGDSPTSFFPPFACREFFFLKEKRGKKKFNYIEMKNKKQNNERSFIAFFL